MNQERLKKISALTLVLAMGTAFSLGLQGILSVVKAQKQKASLTEVTKTNTQEIPDLFQNIPLEAHAVYVLDLASGKVLFARNEDQKLPLASVTKLMTTLVAKDYASSTAMITLTKDDLSAEGDSGLRVGEHWKLENLLDIMLLVSSNDAAHGIASFVGAEGKHTIEQPVSRAHFIQMMNAKVKVLGFSNMEFFNESGLDIDETTNGGYGSAREVALLMKTLWERYPTALEITTRKDARIYSEDKIAHILPNTDEAIGHFPGLLASKTGYTSLAGGNLAIVFDRGIGSPVVAVVLGSTREGRFSDMEKIVSVALGMVK